jgi:nitrogen fixation protein NifB
MNMMRHCRQCRADAVGLPGEDRSNEFTTEKVMEMDVHYDLEIRQAYQEEVERQRQAVVAARNAELKTLAGEESAISILIAVATKGSGRINEHFGHAKEFQVYEVSTSGAKFVGHRRVDNYCQDGFGEVESLETVIRAINDCTAVFMSRIGNCPREGLLKADIEPVDRFALEYIEQSAITYYREYLERVRSGEIVHKQRGDAEIRQGALITAVPESVYPGTTPSSRREHRQVATFDDTNLGIAILEPL